MTRLVFAFTIEALWCAMKLLRVCQVISTDRVGGGCCSLAACERDLNLNRFASTNRQTRFDEIIDDSNFDNYDH